MDGGARGRRTKKKAKELGRRAAAGEKRNFEGGCAA
uniref:Uncharacterized protein n=1 Tax=Cucumis melo TaxID=3656 RepID=A0A9I9E3S6_CUCME